MLESTFRFEHFEGREYKLRLRKDSGWERGKERILMILQTVNTEGLNQKDILPKGVVRDTVFNSIKYARQVARTYGANPSDAKFAVVNFNSWKHLHLKGNARRDAEAEFAIRMRKLIKVLKPTKIFIGGDNAANALLEVTDSDYRRGWVQDYKGIPTVSSLDMDRMLEKVGQKANLLGFWCRHLAHLMLGKHPFDLSKVYPTPRYVDTLDKFKSMMKALRKAKEVAIDTETNNLSVLHNAIYTIQFAMDHTPDTGWVLPLHHPMTPFSKSDLKLIKQELKEYFTDKSDPLLVFFNGAFDLRVIRRQFNIRTIQRRVWEITAGEHLLDENVSELSSQGAPQGGLLATLCRYNNDFYLRAKFSKADRATTGTTPPNDPEFLKYAAMDVVSLLAIRKMQLKTAQTIKLDGKNYRPMYERHVEHIMGPTVQQLSHLSEDGSFIDRRYMRVLLGAESPLRAKIKEAADKFKTSKAAKECNKRILAESGMKSVGMGWSSGGEWAFNPSKPAHRAKLFFEVLGLKPISQTKTGADAVDKHFVKHYKGHPEVDIYNDWSKLQKLLGTYIKGWNKILQSNQDAVTDGYLRSYYTFFDVLTGRLASKKPGLQQIPSRGDLAKIIKRLFIAPEGKLLIRFDYSAHEVRGWSIVSGDMTLANAFRAGQKLRQQWIQTPTDEVKTELKTKGDIHIQNVKRFFGKWVSKDDPLRDAVKAVIFGLLYGKSAKTLGEDIGKDKDYAQSIIDKTFKEFPNGAKWTNKMKKMAKEDLVVFSPIGRCRNLYACLTGDEQIIARQVRRGSNAPIQGFASEIGMVGSRLILNSYYAHQKYFMDALGIEESLWDNRVEFNRVIHDASYFAVPYSMVIPFIHILQWEATYGISKYCEDKFGLKFTVEPEIEIEIGAKDDNTIKWDWSLPHLMTALKTAIKDADELGVLVGSIEEVERKVFAPYKDKKMRKYLQEHFPLLNVRNLDKQMKDAVEEATA